eukprot:4390954-Prymnesium_polylepis.1
MRHRMALLSMLVAAAFTDVGSQVTHGVGTAFSYGVSSLSYLPYALPIIITLRVLRKLLLQAPEVDDAATTDPARRSDEPGGDGTSGGVSGGASCGGSSGARSAGAGGGVHGGGSSGGGGGGGRGGGSGGTPSGGTGSSRAILGGSSRGNAKPREGVGDGGRPEGRKGRQQRKGSSQPAAAQPDNVSAGGHDARSPKAEGVSREAATSSAMGITASEAPSATEAVAAEVAAEVCKTAAEAEARKAEARPDTAGVLMAMGFEWAAAEAAVLAAGADVQAAVQWLLDRCADGNAGEEGEVGGMQREAAG